MAGYLGAEATTLEFDNQAEFNIVKNSQAYGGHLFAVQMTNGVVTNLMGRQASSNNKAWILSDGTHATNAIPHMVAGASVYNMGLNTAISGTTLTVPSAAQFVCGITGGNNYRDNTAGTRMTNAIWIVDNAAEAPLGDPLDGKDRNVVWDRSRNEIVVYSDWPASTVVARYSLNGAKIVGDDLEYLNTSNKNDITIVYENTASGLNIDAALEVYVTTYRNVTPGENNTITYDIEYNNDGTFDVTRKVGGNAQAPASNVSVNVKIVNKNNATVYDGATTDFTSGGGSTQTFNFAGQMATGGWQEYTVTFDFGDCATEYVCGPYLR